MTTSIARLVCRDGHPWRRWDSESQHGECIGGHQITVPVEAHPDRSHLQTSVNGHRSANPQVQSEKTQENASTAPPSSSRPARVVTVATVNSEAVEWYWPGRVPRGKKVVLDGDPGTGKSTLSLDLVARLTKGRPMPDGGRGDVDGPVSCLLLSAEDGIADTIRPRLEAANADLDRVHVFAGVAEANGERLPTLADVSLIQEQIERFHVGMVVVDPLMAFIGGETNTYRDQDVRRLLAPLTAVCEQTRATLLLVRHLNKAAGGQALYRGGGSIGIIGDARAGLLAAKDPDDPNRRVLAMTKSNLAVEAPALAYRLVDAGNGAARIEWDGQTSHTAAQLLSPPPAERAPSKAKLAEAFLLEYLSSGARFASDIYDAAEVEGIDAATVKYAKRKLGARLAVNKDGYQGRWVWELAVPEAAKGINNPKGINPTEVIPLGRVYPFDDERQPSDCPGGCGRPASPRTDGLCWECIERGIVDAVD